MCSNTISNSVLTHKHFNLDNTCDDTGGSPDNLVVNRENLPVEAVTIIRNNDSSPENCKKINFRQRIRSLREKCEDGPLLASTEDLSDTTDDSDFIVASRNRKEKKTKSSLQRNEVDRGENSLIVAHDITESDIRIVGQQVVDQNSLQKILEFVNICFPNMKQSEFNNLLQTVKEENSKSLNGLSCHEIFARIETLKYKLDNEKGTNTNLEQLNRKPAWRSASKNVKKRVLDCNECTICYQPWTENKVVLEECGHCFHSECIRLWMKRKNTCPFCATYSLLLDDFPKLANT